MTESTEPSERAEAFESTEVPERAGTMESTSAGERAESVESTVTDERAAARESTVVHERAAKLESTVHRERAEDYEDDTLTKTGAHQLAARLDAYWRAQGAKTVRHWVVAASGPRNQKSHRPIFVVRS